MLKKDPQPQINYGYPLFFAGYVGIMKRWLTYSNFAKCKFFVSCSEFG